MRSKKNIALVNFSHARSPRAFWVSFVLLLAVMSDALAAGNGEASYRIVAGKGNPLCEAYLRNLRAFGADDRDPVCAPRPHPTSKDFAEPTWEPMSISQHIPLIYQAEMKSGIYLDHPERHPAYDRWRSDFEAKTKSGEIHPLLKRTQVEFVKSKPITIVAYTRNNDACEAELARNGASDNIGHHWFFYDEKRGLLERDKGSAGLSGSILLFRNRPFVVNTVSTAEYVYIYENRETNRVYAPSERCRYDVDDSRKPASVKKQRPFSK